MTEQEFAEKVNEIRLGMKWFESTVHFENKAGHENRMYVTENQAKIIQAVFDLLRQVAFQIPFNNFKEFAYAETKPIDLRGCGTPVRIRSCRAEHGDKTYFGILLGDIALSMSHKIKGNTVTASHAGYNPAIFVPELKTIIYGCESFWGKIKPDQIDKLITDETISDCWYVKALKAIEEK